MKIILVFFAVFLAFLFAGCVNNSSSQQVSWSEAVKLLNDGQVKSVSQAYNLEVSLVLNDGRTVKTVEPEIDLIFEEIRKCGVPCSKITQATE